MEYPWYKTLTKEDDIQQGDFVPNCEIIIPSRVLITGGKIDVEVKIMDCVILSQSCDLINKHVEIVLVCPYFKLNDFLSFLPKDQTSTQKAKRHIVENLCKGNFPSYHLLNKQEGIFHNFQVVDFRNVYGLHVNYLIKTINQLNNRFRLLPPYREHLSQAFARYFMRVGLPQDINISEYYLSR